MSPKIAVLGGGSWGATVASHLAKNGLKVSLWEFFEERVREMRSTKTLSTLPQLRIPESVDITSELGEALKESEIVFSVVPSEFVRQTWKSVNRFSPPIKLAVSLTKGIESGSLKRMSQIITEEYPPCEHSVVVVSGPSHAEEVAQGIPTAVVAAAQNRGQADEVQKMMGTETFRVYTSPDVIGAELCGALKNIFAIACGACDGMGLGDNTKSALITRGLSEMVKLGVRLGGKEATFYGLAGMGDLVVTCFSQHSRNRLFGEKIGHGKTAEQALKEMTMVAEGVPNAKSAYQLIRKYGCDCPIITEIYKVIYEGKDAKASMHDLLTRPMHTETETLEWN